MFKTLYIIIQYKSGINMYNRWSTINESTSCPQNGSNGPSLVFKTMRNALNFEDPIRCFNYACETFLKLLEMLFFYS